MRFAIHWISREWGNVRESNHSTRNEMNNTLKEEKMQTGSIESALYTGIKRAWYKGGTWPNPLVTGVVSMSFTSTRGFRLKFCKMVVKNRNSSIRARPSPAHIRFPEGSKHKVVPELLCCELSCKVSSK